MAEKYIGFPSPTLILLALEQTNGRNSRDSLEKDLWELCSELINKHDVVVYMDFKPWHDGTLLP